MFTLIDLLFDNKIAQPKLNYFISCSEIVEQVRIEKSRTLISRRHRAF